VEDSRITFNGSRLDYPLPGGGSAIYNSSGLNFIRHTDWLGSSRLATTWAAHAVYSKEAYAPFGETYNEAGTADRSFTGQDQDVITGSLGTGVNDFLFRKHDPSAGRWLSPDPYGWNAVDITNPQTLNRYAYVANNPLTYADFAGLGPEDCDGTGTEYGWQIPCVPLASFTFDDQASVTATDSFDADEGTDCSPEADSLCNYSIGFGQFNQIPYVPMQQFSAPNNVALVAKPFVQTTVSQGQCSDMRSSTLYCGYTCTFSGGEEQPSVVYNKLQMRIGCGHLSCAVGFNATEVSTHLIVPGAFDWWTTAVNINSGTCVYPSHP
jgi:RHS repeat-associated protein